MPVGTPSAGYYVIEVVKDASLMDTLLSALTVVHAVTEATIHIF